MSRSKAQCHNANYSDGIQKVAHKEGLGEQYHDGDQQGKYIENGHIPCVHTQIGQHFEHLGRFIDVYSVPKVFCM
tara:strand:- start:956 stop:1180 length:225 start_codon:yes stop_codon:yes gene_type:complete